ncbi:kinesin-1 [Heterostelium album PN500]|uniref:Kinesin-like protein n=1 Tax=Heterostelium pallidum (strain ATCC 26659 / Pp 5 / PN500) TaxID=670386 RepID=D3BBQ6_HETP5|nr:kinesin-1 [Heterostelium album PN500]EFA81089.1 kinesin-1 [Heterostelium album PN500]|eukprot:XP_020433207.1 kinesin-1 [Heterostelium album PN500]
MIPIINYNNNNNSHNSNNSSNNNYSGMNEPNSSLLSSSLLMHQASMTSSISTTAGSIGIGNTSLSSSTSQQHQQQQLGQSQGQGQSNCIRVVCRFRPLTESEQKRNEHSIIQFIDNQSFIVKQRESQQQYSFDRTFNSYEDQSVIFQDVAIPIVQVICIDFLDGYNGTILAYGQTASGKTYTIYGEPSGDDDSQSKNGLIPRVIEEIFTGIAKMRQKNNALAFVLKMSCVELYMEKINDLYNVNGTNLHIREHPEKGIYVEGVNETVIQCPEDAFEFLNTTNNNRAVAATKMSQASSRSHSILMIELSQQNLLDLSSKKSKLFLVDLAGSERASKTGAEGERMAEAKTINQSLSTLGTVINSLTHANKTHVPYRNSKLTRVLQESLGGNSKTTLIIACSPSNYNESETVSTIQFGLRAKKITNKPKINKEITVVELKQLLEKSNLRIKELEDFIVLLQNDILLQKQFIDTLEKEKQEAIDNQIVIGSGGAMSTENGEPQPDAGLSLTCNKKLRRELSANSSLKVKRLRDRVFKPMNLKDLSSNENGNNNAIDGTDGSNNNNSGNNSSNSNNSTSNNQHAKKTGKYTASKIPSLSMKNYVDNHQNHQHEDDEQEQQDEDVVVDEYEGESGDDNLTSNSNSNSGSSSKNISDDDDNDNDMNGNTMNSKQLDELLHRSLLGLNKHQQQRNQFKEKLLRLELEQDHDQDDDDSDSVVPINSALDQPTPPISPRALPRLHQSPPHSLSNSFSMILPSLSRDPSFTLEHYATQPLTDSLNDIIVSHNLEDSFRQQHQQYQQQQVTSTNIISTSTTLIENQNSTSTSTSSTTTPSTSIPTSPKQPKQQIITSSPSSSNDNLKLQQQSQQYPQQQNEIIAPNSPKLIFNPSTTSVTNYEDIKKKSNTLNNSTDQATTSSSPITTELTTTTKPTKTNFKSTFFYLSIIIVFLAISASLYINPAQISDKAILQNHLFKLGIVNNDSPTLDQLKKSYKSSLLK